MAAQTCGEHLDEWALCENLGFDGAMVNEHHFTYFNITPSTVLAAALIMRIKRMKVSVIAHVLPLGHSIQTAEEFAQLDILSGGRFIGGIVRGVPRSRSPSTSTYSPAASASPKPMRFSTSI